MATSRTPCDFSCASERCTLTASGVVWVGVSSRPRNPQPIVPM